MTTVIRFGTLLSIVFTLITICFMRNVEAAVYVPASGRTLFGSPSGSDANDCSMPAPCRQIRRALGLVQSGDLISVADGSYLGFNLEDKHGTACPQGLATDIGAYEQSASSSPVSCPTSRTSGTSMSRISCATIPMGAN